MKFTMRKSLVLTIMLMSMMTVGFAILTGEIYSRLGLENQSVAFRELAELEVHNRWDKVKDEAIQMGLSIRQDKKFKLPANESEYDLIIERLNEQFHRAYVTLGLLDLKKLIMHDQSMNTLLQSTEGDREFIDECPELVETVRARQGAERLKAVSQVCVFKEQLRLVAIVPLGGLRLEGYLSVVVDPLPALSLAEKGLGIPLLIKTVQGTLLYRSDDWPATDQMDDILLVDYGLKAGNKSPVSHFLFASNVKKLRHQLSQTRLMIIIVVVLVTLFAMAIALGLFRRTIILPLSQITERLHLIQKDKTYLKENIVIRGSSELEVLANDLNLMSSELHRLYYELEVMAFTDSLTGIPNRALLFDRLQQMTLFAKRDASQGEFMLMMMDLNRFKAVNDELGHHIGDELLKAVAERLQQALRSSDTVARLGGDEFAVILYSVSDKQVAENVAKKITRLMSQLFVVGEYELDVGMSIGIARFPYDGDDSSHLMQRADMAMYYAKQNKIPYMFYSDEIRRQRPALNTINETE